MQDLTLQDAVALHKAGRLDAAASAYRELIASGRGDRVACGVNLGRVLSQQGAYDEAEKVLRSTWRQLPHPRVRVAQVDLALARGRLDTALALAEPVDGETGALLRAKVWLARGDNERALQEASQTEGPGLLADVGTALRARGLYPEAIAAYRAALERAPGHLQLRAYLGVTSRDAGDLRGAIRVLEAVVAERADYAWARYVLAQCCLETGAVRDAQRHFARSTDELEGAWALFVDAVFLAGELADEVDDDVLIRALQRDDIDAQRLDRAIRGRLPADDEALVCHPLFVPWVSRCIVQSIQWEERLHALKPAGLTDAARTALGRYRWHTEEAAGRWEEPLPAAVAEEIARHAAEERELASRLPCLGLANDEVSAKVRAQYEQNPYPRLVQIQRREAVPFASWLHQVLPGVPAPPGRPLAALVAGGGTGQHPLTVATTFSDVDVLAIDLSRASLARAWRKARRWGVGNIRFAQADILALDGHAHRYSIVDCVGVLHHLDDPPAGLRILSRLLTDQGLVRLGLYSQRARRGVQAARQLVHDLPATETGIREARRRLKALPSQHIARSVTHSLDFFSLSGCRDLVLHAREHVYTPRQLGPLLEQAGLRLVGFQHPRPEAAELYQDRFPDAPDALDLENWEILEEAHPDLFGGMFVFWARADR